MRRRDAHRETRYPIRIQSIGHAFVAQLLAGNSQMQHRRVADFTLFERPAPGGQFGILDGLGRVLAAPCVELVKPAAVGGDGVGCARIYA